MKDNHTLISLFAGAGGLDIGLEQAGFKTLAINELETHACETLRQNKQLALLSKNKFDSWLSEQMGQRCHKNASQEYINALRIRLQNTAAKHNFLERAQVIEGDIRTINSEQMLSAAGITRGELTLVAGGPPCQPFSRAGKRETVEVEDGRLFLEFVRVVEDCSPRWFLFENVKGLAQSKTSVPYVLCKSCQSESIVPFKYRADALKEIIKSKSCKNCGSDNLKVSLKEVRGGSLEIIINEFESIGYHCQYRVLNAADYGVPQSRERLFIVGSRDNEPFIWPNPTHIASIKNNKGKKQLSFLTEERAHLQPWLTVKDVLWKNGHPEFGKLNYEHARIWVKNVVRPHDEAVTWSLNRPSPTVGAHQAAKLALAPEGVPQEQLARQQWHTKGKRQRDLPPVFVKHAMLSDGDLLDLQTFPQNWYLHGTRMERAFQIGNAVPPILACAVGKSILAACKKSILPIEKKALEVAVA